MKCNWIYLDVCHEKNSIEDKLRAKFDNEIRSKLDELRRNLEREHHDKLAQCKSHSEEEFERYQEQNKEIERMKITHEKSLHQLNIELDRLRANGKYSISQRTNATDKSLLQLDIVSLRLAIVFFPNILSRPNHFPPVVLVHDTLPVSQFLCIKTELGM